jgi:hypothetical protein
MLDFLETGIHSLGVSSGEGQGLKTVWRTSVADVVLAVMAVLI